jgi:hypothetical protein
MLFAVLVSASPFVPWRSETVSALSVSQWVPLTMERSARARTPGRPVERSL